MAEMSKPFLVSVNGVVLAYASEVNQQTESNDKAVFSLRFGWVGFSDGASTGRVTLKSTIPASGREVDFKEFCRQHVTQTFSIRGGSKAVTLLGRILTVSEQSSVNSPNEIDVTFEGGIVSNA